MRPIDAEALKKDLTRFYDNEVTARELIDEQPTADVQPVKQWYSVEENQPDSVGDDVLVVDSYGKYHIAYYLSGSENWMNQDTREPIKDVVKWRYLDGDGE